MPLLSLFVAVLLLAYGGLIFYYLHAWNRVPAVVPAGAAVPGSAPAPATVSVSVIIPARNEAAAIGACVDALKAQCYPSSLLEIIVVDDHSADETAVIARRRGCRVIDLSQVAGLSGINSFKKKAIETGIAAAAGQLIVCTDADCISGTEWIATMVTAYNNRYSLLAGPVRIDPNGSALGVFQALDFISLQGITGAAVSRRLYPMANGANLAYARAAFDAVGGFAGIDHIASGDDMLLMKKMQDRYPGGQAYVKDPRAIVSTAAAGSLGAFFRQRIRWASKTAHYGHPPTVITLALVYGLNLALLLLFVACFFSGQWLWLVALLVGKTLIEMPFVVTVASFFGQSRLLVWFPLCQPFHILYTVLAGTFGSFGKVQWKGRRVR